MPTAQAILNDIDARCPNNFTQQQKVDWLNDVQRKVFREMALQEILEFDTVMDNPVYDITEPANGNLIEFELIKSVTVDNAEYAPADLNDPVKNNIYFKLLDGKMGIHPTPTKSGLKMRVFYEKRPIIMTTSNLNDKPQLREDYHDILKFAVMDIISVARGDIAAANNYRMDYNAMLQEIKQKKYEQMAKYPTTKDVLPRRLRRVSEVV